MDGGHGKRIGVLCFSSWKEVDNVPNSRGKAKMDFYLGRDLLFIYF